MSKLDFSTPENQAKLPRTRAGLPPVGTSKDILVKDWISMVQHGVVTPYQNNRGDTSYSTKTAKKCREELHEHSLQIFTVNERGMICDGHSRTQGILQRLYSGEMPPNEFDFKLTVKTVSEEESLVVYRNVNAQDSHKTKDKLKNPDYALGRLLKEIKDLISGDVESLNTSFNQQIANIVVAVNDNRPNDFSYASCYEDLRKKVTRTLNEFTSEYRLSREEKQNIAHAIEFYMALRQRLQRTDVPGIKKSGPFFGLVVADRIQSSPRLEDPAAVARRIARKPNTMEKLVADLARGSVAAQEDTADQVFRIVELRKTRKS
jgi:hypothetical protein